MCGYGYLRIVQGQQGGGGGGGVLNHPCMTGSHDGLVVQHSMGEARQVQTDHQPHLAALLHLLNTCTRHQPFCCASLLIMSVMLCTLMADCLEAVVTIDSMCFEICK